MGQRNERLIQARGTRTQEAVARAVQRRCPGHRTRDGELRPCAFGREQLSRAECGGREHLSLEHIRLLCEEYDQNAVELGLMDADMFGVLSGQATESGDPTTTGVQPAEEQAEKVSMKRRQFLRGVGILLPATAALPPELANAIDLARRVQTSGSFAQVVEGLSAETRTLISAYEYVAEDLLEPEIEGLTDRIIEILDQDIRVRDRMQLYFDLAQLHTIKSLVHHGRWALTDMRVAAGTVRTLAQEIGHRDLEAWSYLLQADTDIDQGHYADAVVNAREAYDAASSDALRAKAASRGLARAFARHGNAAEAQRAVRLAEEADSRTRDEDARGGVFSLDRADVPMYAGGALLWIGTQSRDHRLITQARDQSQRGLDILVERGEWPREQAETRLDVAAATTLLDDPEHALQLARMSFQQHSPTPWMQFGADNVRRALPPSLQSDFQELTSAWTRGELVAP